MKTNDSPEKKELNRISGNTFSLIWLLLLMINILLVFLHQINHPQLYVRIGIVLVSIFLVGFAAVQRLRAVGKPLYSIWLIFIPIFNLMFLIWLSLMKDNPELTNSGSKTN